MLEDFSDECSNVGVGGGLQHIQQGLSNDALGLQAGQGSKELLLDLNKNTHSLCSVNT